MQKALKAGHSPSSSGGCGRPATGKYEARGSGSYLSIKYLAAPLNSRGGSRSSGIAAARVRRSSSSARPVKIVAVSLQEAGAPGTDHPAATSRA
jgi:hypothetical protein